jgi:hypothetical protein
VELVDFLRQRLDEDEQVARAAVMSMLDGDWQAKHYKAESAVMAGPTAIVAEPVAQVDAEHIARHDPARVLAEVEAKRQIIAEHTVTETSEFEGKTATITYCPVCRNDGECPTLRLLALPYADHPDYDPGWKP